MAVFVDDIARELGRPASSVTPEQVNQWQAWIDRAYRVIAARAARLGTSMPSLDSQIVDDVVTYAVVRRTGRPVDGAESMSEQVSVDDGSLQRTRRWGVSAVGDVFILDEWWALLGLSEPLVDGWSGSIKYTGGR